MYFEETKLRFCGLGLNFIFLKNVAVMPPFKQIAYMFLTCTENFFPKLKLLSHTTG